MSNTVFIATSLDGYIADKDGGLDWLHSIPNPDNLDMGWVNFIDRIDALVMGQRTFDIPDAHCTRIPDAFLKSDFGRDW